MNSRSTETGSRTSPRTDFTQGYGRTQGISGSHGLGGGTHSGIAAGAAAGPGATPAAGAAATGATAAAGATSAGSTMPGAGMSRHTRSLSALDLLELRGLPRDPKLLNRSVKCPSSGSHDVAGGSEPARNAWPEEGEVSKHPYPEIPAVNANACAASLELPSAPLRRHTQLCE
jgi:hypothetical protein